MATSFATPQRRAIPGPRSRRLLALFDDDRLAREIARGNEAAFEVLYDRHHRGLLAFCRHLLGSREEAEDALQQTFVSAYDHLTRTGAEVRLKAWLYTIARNRCISTIRARHEEPTENVEALTDGLQQQVQDRADLRQMLADLQLLPIDQRSALILSELKGLSHEDIAGILGVNTTKVKALVFQARSHLLDYRTARETPCLEVRREVAARKRGAPNGIVRRHLAICSDCARFSTEVREQRRALGLLIPVVPVAGLKSQAFAAAGVTGGSASTGSGASAGTWIASHAQVLKIAAIGAAAMTGVVASIPLVLDNTPPAHALSTPAVTTPPALWPLTAGGQAFPAHSGARHAAHAKGPPRASSAHHGKATRRHVVRREAVAPSGAHRHFDSSGGRARHPSALAPGHHYAYGHLHARGWIRNHGGSSARGPAPARGHSPKKH